MKSEERPEKLITSLSSHVVSMKSEELSEELIYSILLNLPLKTLLCFRSISKRWNDIITRRAFAIHRSINSRSKYRADHLFIHSWSDSIGEIHHYTNLYEMSSCRGKFPLPLKLFEHGDKRHKPITEDGCWFESSSWDGMLCTPRYETDETASILVWNPFTRRSRQVSWPVPYTDRNTVRESFVGFGYDRTTDDYKIVVHTHDFSASVFRTYVMALKSSNDVWRNIDELSVPWGRRESKPVTLDNGDVYWVSWSKGAMSDNISEEYYWVSMHLGLGLGRFLILKFNFTDERLTIMPSPPKDDKLGELFWTGQLGECEGRLCFINYYYQIGVLTEAHWIRIWTLLAARDDNGSNIKATTWVRAMHVPLPPMLRSYESLFPLGFTMSGDLMMRIRNSHRPRDDKLIVYVARENRFGVLHAEDDDALPGWKQQGAKYYHLLHTESLIWPAYHHHH